MSKLEECILGDLVEFQRGYDLPKSKFVEGKYPVQSSNGILGYHNEYKVEGPGITIGRSGTVGNPHLIRENFFPHNTSLFVKEFKGNDIEYIYYLLQYLDLGNQKSGSGVPTMNRNHLHPIKIRAYRDKTYQQRTIKILSLIDKKIQINNQINQELEAMAKTLYDYWFVQFDFPDQNGKPYKSSGGKMVYNPELKREIPDGWGVTKLNEVVDLISGYPFSSNDYVTSGKYKLYTIKNVQDGYTVDKVDNYLDFLPSNMSHECQLRRGDLIMSLTGNVGRVGMVYEDDVLLNQRVLKLNPINKTHKSFIYSFFRSDVTKAHLENMSTGTSQKNLSPIDIGNMMIPFPSESLLSKFLDNLNMLENNLVENQQLTKLRDWLLPMLMNGQVKVK